MTIETKDILRVNNTTVNIEAGGIADTQWAFSTDELQLIVRHGANYRHMAGIDALNIFTDVNTFDTISLAGNSMVNSTVDDQALVISGGLGFADGASVRLTGGISAGESSRLNFYASGAYMFQQDIALGAFFNTDLEMEAGKHFTLGPGSNIIGSSTSTLGVAGITATDNIVLVNASAAAYLSIDGAAGLDAGISFFENGTAKYTMGYDASKNVFSLNRLSAVIGVDEIFAFSEVNDSFWLGSGRMIQALTNGDIGINDSSPSFKLDVNGTFRAVGLSRLDGGATIGSGTALQLGVSHNAIGAETLSGYMIIKDSGGTDRKVAVIS